MVTFLIPVKDDHKFVTMLTIVIQSMNLCRWWIHKLMYYIRIDSKLRWWGGEGDSRDDLNSEVGVERKSWGGGYYEQHNNKYPVRSFSKLIQTVIKLLSIVLLSQLI